MKKMTLGVFRARAGAEHAINTLHYDLKIAADDISYLYRNAKGEMRGQAVDVIQHKSPVDGAVTGGLFGATLGAVGGAATVVGILPAIEPLFAAGPLLDVLGLGTGLFGTVVTATTTGLLAGSLLGALVNLIASGPISKEYEKQLIAGDVLVAVRAEEDSAVESVFSECGATKVESYSSTI